MSVSIMEVLKLKYAKSILFIFYWFVDISFTCVKKIGTTNSFLMWSAEQKVTISLYYNAQ